MKRAAAPASLPRLATLAVVTMLLTVAAEAADEAGNATATVVVPIAILATAELNFDRFAANGGGTVAISTTGERTASGTVALSTAGSSHAAAVFDVTGETGASYAVSLPGDGLVSLGDGLGNTMQVNGFASDPSASGSLAAGAQSVSVGAVLTVGDGQAPGTYTGSFTVTVEYN